MSSEPLQRRLSAIMFTDIVGFSKLMGHDEVKALRVLELQRELVSPAVEEFQGRILKEMGDGLLVEFGSSVNAVQCASAIQAATRASNESSETPFQVRIGIHVGDVVVLGNDILGDGVNIAARIEPLASPGGICMTQAVYQSVKSTLSLDAGRIDDVKLKNIDDEYTLYTIPSASVEGNRQPSPLDQRFARLEIENVEDGTEILREVGQTMLFALPIVGIFYLPAAMFGVFLASGRFLFDPDAPRVVALLAGAVVALIVTGGVLHRRTKILSLTDVRHVGVLLDMLILRMNYGLQRQSGNKIEYLHHPWKWKQRKIFSWIKWADTLTVTFDGNRVSISGPYFHVRKLPKALRKYDRRNPVSPRTS